jgi:L-alanine-DL-glutamate epimerase-like enolase superfamily enzyme
MPRIRQLVLRRLNLPLVRPYRLAYRTFESFEPFFLEIEDSDGGKGFSDAHIAPGSSLETREGGWAFLCDRINQVIGLTSEEAKAVVLRRFEESKVATTVLVTAIEVMENSPTLDVPHEIELPLLAPINALDEKAIREEVESWLDNGFRTFKVKVGKDVESDLERVAIIQDAVAERATLRLDANRAYTRDDGIRFAEKLDPSGIELFEQPCDSEDWDANAAVARASAVPLMLDEPICTLADIERAAGIEGVRFCKLKLKRFGSLDRLKEGLDAVYAHGMVPVLGDGLGSEIHSWLEACVAQTTIRNAGEFNGFLKPRDGLFVEPMPFRDGSIWLPAGYRPQFDPVAIDRATIERREFH